MANAIAAKPIVHVINPRAYKHADQPKGFRPSAWNEVDYWDINVALPRDIAGDFKSSTD